MLSMNSFFILIKSMEPYGPANYDKGNFKRRYNMKKSFTSKCVSSLQLLCLTSLLLAIVTPGYAALSTKQCLQCQDEYKKCMDMIKKIEFSKKEEHHSHCVSVAVSNLKMACGECL